MSSSRKSLSLLTLSKEHSDNRTLVEHWSGGGEEPYVSDCVRDQSFSTGKVSAILETHGMWESSARTRAVVL